MPQKLLIPLLLLLAAAPAHPQAPTPSERRTNAAFLAARRAGPASLHAFLVRMPKGADLHMHLSGAVYAETFLREALDDKLCIDPEKLAFVKPSFPSPPPPNTAPTLGCAAPLRPATAILTDQRLYDSLVDSFSMRAFVPTPGNSGHDHFFASFAEFSGLDKSHLGDWLDEVATRAAAQNEQYLEVMHTPPFGPVAALGVKLGWPTSIPSGPAANYPPDPTNARHTALASLRDQLLAAPEFRATLALDQQEFADALAARNRIEECGTVAARPGCSVHIRFLFQVLRANPPAVVFAQTLLGFELAAADPEAVVGLNYVQPEDAFFAMREYHRQMLFLEYLHATYPAIHLSLHAGELAPGLVPPDGLNSHIWEAVTLAGATRIGHGVDVLYEHDAPALLAELARRHTMIEINLTSNDVILGISAPNHPLPAYLAAHVPVALSTDDEGVSRIDLTHEYVRAAIEHGLDYLALKRLARTSLEHTFLPGPSLWLAPDTFTRTIPACAHDPLGHDDPSPLCRTFLAASPHATEQWELEHRLQLFEHQ